VRRRGVQLASAGAESGAAVSRARIARLRRAHTLTPMTMAYPSARARTARARRHIGELPDVPSRADDGDVILCTAASADAVVAGEMERRAGLHRASTGAASGSPKMTLHASSSIAGWEQ
jgi:hypothetical protein